MNCFIYLWFQVQQIKCSTWAQGDECFIFLRRIMLQNHISLYFNNLIKMKIYTRLENLFLTKFLFIQILIR